MGLIDKIVKKKLLNIAKDLLKEAQAKMPEVIIKVKAILKIKIEELRDIAMKKYTDKKAELAELLKKKIQEEKEILKEKAEEKLKQAKAMLEEKVKDIVK